MKLNILDKNTWNVFLFLPNQCKIHIKEMIERELNKAYRIKENASNNKPNQDDPQYKEVDNPTV